MTDPGLSLREVTAASVRAICALKVADSQSGYVAANAVSIAQAHFEPTATFRAAYAEETPVGFIMWRPDSDDPDRVMSLWRFMIDRDHQGKGYGKAALNLWLQQRHKDGIRLVTTSVVLGPASPLDFYRSLGFNLTGEIRPNGESALLLRL
ncbi:diamine N-acetyltransferase [Bosea sp. BE125]|uniref:GNAT family N-acetyltransferase n=1 Tax=Bosea sp. BE125 TaxID=2817909 RepID=UPI002860A9BE|nr:GNAT family N-acetyltransferase [Bosea sp. BE125]MDR6871248.1 diamine N-acetyltransferase [Bosea sp. BE125]